MKDIRFDEIRPTDAPMGLLLDADPSPEKVRGYLDRSRCFVAREQGKIIGCGVVLCTGPDVYELMNIAVAPSHRRMGAGSLLLRHVIEAVRAMGARRLEVGTGTFGYQLTFYQKAGFRAFAVERDFFLKHYTEPIYECGIQLKDMLRLVRDYTQLDAPPAAG